MSKLIQNQMEVVAMIRDYYQSTGARSSVSFRQLAADMPWLTLPELAGGLAYLVAGGELIRESTVFNEWYTAR